ncbi:hypothetical protein PGT21_006706 [Puccinia graminis f. sp. tritici]|uniref:Uncharacterized protein n=1 Tax=Puccinia graminis f. sp. tritici TaxID=56615 RepID=A0A5B0PJW2_PUCGR|nr:hypothetical protein PGTUg99_025006 [Puccinia graminis f. sp. tritici]KAA1101092.1 hypothetical protein PGT21_006706 [Puccinia graminis f. sp. tritici]
MRMRLAAKRFHLSRPSGTSGRILYMILLGLIFCTIRPACREEPLPAVWPLGTGYPLGYPDIRQDFGRKRTSAPAGGYPPADSGYPRRIIRDHLYV